jgi:hypothetical protein
VGHPFNIYSVAQPPWIPQISPTTIRLIAFVPIMLFFNRCGRFFPESSGSRPLLLQVPASTWPRTGVTCSL